MLEKIPGNVIKDSGECSRRFRGMFKKFPKNAIKDSEECYQRFRAMFKKIPVNVEEDSKECFQFYINESDVLLKKANVKLFSKA